MDLRDTPEEAAFRAELRAWLEENLPESSRVTAAARRASTSRRCAPGAARSTTRATRASPGPKEYGGGGAPYTHQAIFLEEMARAEAAPHIGVIGLGMAGPTIMAHGTEEQKGALPRPDPLRRGDLVPGLLRARRRLRPRRRANELTARRRATSSSTARRCGRRSRTSPTGASSSRAAIPSRRVTPGSRT